ncbi:MAG: WbqC family protein [Acidobacteriota bacterium]
MRLDSTSYTKQRIAIAQPTFLPWIGWFDLADQVETLVILDDVPFSKQSWQQRNRIRTAKELEFLTVPVKSSGRMGQLICEVELAAQPFFEKSIKSFQLNYSRAPFFSVLFDGFASAFEVGVKSGRLVDLNVTLITWMARQLGISTPMQKATPLEVAGERGEHVAAICEKLGATQYLSPAGAEGYLLEDRGAFDRRKIGVWLHEYNHPTYSQRFKPFISHASAIDLIFNAGPQAGELMRSGRCAPRPL